MLRNRQSKGFSGRVIAALAAALLGLSSCSAPDMKETSAAFDLEDVHPFLLQLAGGLQGGFEPAAADQVYATIAALPLDSTSVADHTVTFRGKQLPLQVIAYMDDVNSPDIAFRAPSPLVEYIDSTMKAFLEEADP